MDFVKFLEKNYSTHYTLLEILTSISPEIKNILTNEFISYLQSTFLVSKLDLRNILRPNFYPNYDLLARKTFIERFNESTKHLTNDKKPYYNLFNILIGQKMMSELTKHCSIFHFNSKSNYLYLINGKEFYYDCKLNNVNGNDIIKLYNQWNNIKPNYKTMLNLIGLELSGINLLDDHIWREFDLDQRNKMKFMPYAKCSLLFRRDMFYANRKTSANVNCFPFVKMDRKQLLPKAKLDIFGQKTLINAFQRNNIDDYLVKIYENYHKINIESLLKQCCPLSNEKMNGNLNNILSLATSNKNLFKFIYSIYYAIIPAELLGSKRNFRRFNQNLKILFSTCYIVNFRCWDIINGLNIDEMRPVFIDFYQTSNNNFSFEIEMLFLCWIFRLLKYIVRSKFYITETSCLKYKLLFYRYDLWAKIYNHFIHMNITNNRWKMNKHEPVLKEEQLNCNDLAKYLKHSLFRLIPKRKGARPITRLKYAKLRFTKDFSRQTGIILGLLKCLNRPFKTSAIDSQLSLKFILHNKLLKMNANNNNNSNDDFYIVRGDFQDCYGSINLEKLINIVLKLIQKMSKDWNGEKISIGKNNQILLPATLPIKQLNLFRINGAGYRKKIEYLFDPSNGGENLKENTMAELKQLGNSVIYNTIISLDKNTINKKVNTKNLIQLLRAYLNGTIIRLGRKTNCQFQYGIRQGGPLSAELAELYLNYIWQTSMQWLNNEDLFVHFADDFLFITPKLNKAKRFLNILEQLQGSFNLSVNKEKLATNFDPKTGILKRNCPIYFLGRIFSLTPLLAGKKEEKSSLPYNATKMIVKVDFSSFVGIKILDTFSNNPFRPLLATMKMLIGNY